MPDQAPSAPDGCVYGPWWDKQCWLCVAPWKSVTGPTLASQIWNGKEWSRVTEACEPELLRVAKENAELRASQPSEEDRAVLWLMKDKGWEMARTAKGVWSMDGTPIASPVEEAKKLGWGG